jgi:hypothetical protein
MKSCKYLKILSNDEYFKVDNGDNCDDSIACIYLFDSCEPKSFIWTIQDNSYKLKKVSFNYQIFDYDIEKVISVADKIPINDEIFNKLISLDKLYLLSFINKRTFLKYLNLHEWVI